MNGNAFITGATGWLGTRLVKALLEGLPDVPSLASPASRKITCLLRESEGKRHDYLKENTEVVYGDLADADSLREFLKDSHGAVLFHTAGVIHPRRRKEFYTVNDQGTRNLVAAAQKAGVKRMVHVSSNSPFGFSSPGRPFDEESPYRPYQNYGRSKKLAEEHVLRAGDSGEMETVIVRPPWFYGPDQPERQSRFISMIRHGKAPVVGSGENRRSMAYVDNICQALLLCESSEAAAGEAFWIADKRPYTMNEIIDTVKAVLEEDFGLPVPEKRPWLPGIASGTARVVDTLVQSAGLYQQEFHVLSEMNKNIACSIAKAERVLGYAPAIELREGMRRSVQWMLDRGIEV